MHSTCQVTLCTNVSRSDTTISSDPISLRTKLRAKNVHKADFVIVIGSTVGKSVWQNCIWEFSPVIENSVEDGRELKVTK